MAGPTCGISARGGGLTNGGTSHAERSVTVELGDGGRGRGQPATQLQGVSLRPQAPGSRRSSLSARDASHSRPSWRRHYTNTHPSHVHTHTYAGEAHPGLPCLYRGFSHRSGPSITGAPLANLGGAGKVRLRLPPAPPKVPSGQLVSACWLSSRVSSLATNASWRGRGPGDRPPP